MITAVALGVTTLLPGIEIGSGSRGSQTVTLLLVALVFGLVNAIVKPVIKTLGCTLYVLTLGLIGLLVNAFLFWLTAWIATRAHVPFHVTGFVPAFWGAIVISVVSFILHLILDRFEPQPHQDEL